MSMNKKPGQPSKAIRYPNERKMVALKILNLLGVTKDNNIFKLNDKTTAIQESILNLEDEIKIYFNVGKWPFFKKNTDIEKCYLSIVKSVMKEVGIEMTNIYKYVKGERLSCYQFNIDNINLDN